MRKTITVITVVYNDCKHIEETILSVINQEYNNIEFIVIDGDSKDGTIDIIKKYSDRIDYWVSEKDRGIYDAMNKGIRAANGRYTIFMNSGDVFYNSKVLEDIFYGSEQLLFEADVIYGDTFIRHGVNIVHRPVPAVPVARNAMPFCHQSVFICTELLKKQLFDLSYRIIGDRVLVTRLFIENCRFHYVKMPVALIEGEGYSNQSRLRYQKEVNRLMLTLGFINRRRALIKEKQAWVKDLLSGWIPARWLQIKRRYKT
ncbi:glycosyltransferase [Chitinophaga polysaccharea]|uniref:glycosyltransferase family 2 protein n=1 Tax=Chitinophaga polysaccharea TaxID=1293035 RepID=UPI001454FBD6|nr:glycosyltransferase family 2 protein [Chitinophaga polysaccharea]NLR61865.1 glycosyltransferase [Chitinophaga polysaccharea]